MISIHQSQFLSWAPFYYKVLKSDNFVILDDVQFQKNGVQNRNLIKTPQGKSWLTIPVKHNLSTLINEVKIDNLLIYQKLLKTFDSNYKKSLYFTEVYNLLEEVFKMSFVNLNDLNNALLKKILHLLDSNVCITYSSDIISKSTKDDLVIDIIKQKDDLEYLSGPGALEYMDLEKFKREGIKVFVYEFSYKPYNQLWNKQAGFVKDLSIIDLLFNEMGNATNYIHNAGSIKRVI
jgi:hypothetical protein